MRRTRSSRGPLVVATAVIVVILGLVAWNNGVKDQLIPNEFGVVEDGRIYRSGRLTERMLRKVLEENGIRTVVDLAGWDEGTPVAETEARVCHDLGVERHVFYLHGDATGDPNAYVAALRIMTDETQYPVLVHCAAGSQRTGAAVLLYERIENDTPFDESFDATLRHGHDPADNPLLLLYLAEWADDIAASYESGEPIPWGDTPPAAGQ